MYIQKFKIVMAVCCMYKSIVDALNMGYNPVYVTQVTGASYNNGEIVICKKCGSSMKYNHQKIILGVQIIYVLRQYMAFHLCHLIITKTKLKIYY